MTHGLTSSLATLHTQAPPAVQKKFKQTITEVFRKLKLGIRETGIGSETEMFKKSLVLENKNMTE